MPNTSALATEIETRCKHWRTLPPHPTDLLNAIKTWQRSVDAKADAALSRAAHAAMGSKATKGFGDFPRPDMPAVLDALTQAVKALRETDTPDEPYYRAHTTDALKATRVGDAAKALPPVVQQLTDLIVQLRGIRGRLGGDENMKPYLQHVYNRFNDILHLDVRFQREVPTMYWGSAGGMLSKLAGDYIVYPQNAEKNLDAAVSALKRLVQFAVGYYNVKGKRDPNRSI